MFCDTQELLSIQVATLIEDPQKATLKQLVDEALSAAKEPAAGGTEGPVDQASTSVWIARSPISIKLRLYCLPYAGGVSGNVFAK